MEGTASCQRSLHRKREEQRRAAWEAPAPTDKGKNIRLPYNLPRFLLQEANAGFYKNSYVSEKNKIKKPKSL